MKNTGFKKKDSSSEKYYFKNKPLNMVKHSFKSSRVSLKKFRKVEGPEDVIQVAEADRLFSLEIRHRDGKCLNCGSTLFLGCSHFFGRGNYATRYDPLNCITLCQSCHEIWEHEKKEIYKDFMIMWLGEDGFAALEARAKEKISPYQSIKNFMESPYYQPSKDIEY